MSRPYYEDAKSGIVIWHGDARDVLPRLQVNDMVCIARNAEHARWVVKWWSEPDATVLDPFGGSGTTARACKDLGRKCVLIEVEEKFGIYPFDASDA